MAIFEYKSALKFGEKHQKFKMNAFVTFLILSSAAVLAMEIPQLEMEAQNELNSTFEYEDEDKDFGKREKKIQKIVQNFTKNYLNFFSGVVPEGVLFADASPFNYKAGDPNGKTQLSTLI